MHGVTMKIKIKPRTVIIYRGSCLGKCSPGLYPRGKAAGAWR
jgi:hypothetical protein